MDALSFCLRILGARLAAVSVPETVVARSTARLHPDKAYPTLDGFKAVFDELAKQVFTAKKPLTP